MWVRWRARLRNHGLRVLLLLLVLGLGAALGGCDNSAAGLEIGGAVQLLASRPGQGQGTLGEQALRQLVPYGREALPYLEAALHTAPPAGRRNLAIALRRLGLAETASLLGHIAAFDSDWATAREAWKTLSLWASERGPRAVAARQALRKVDEVRGMSALLLDAQ